MKEVSESRIVVGMSGGVDSSVAALLLRRQGAAVSGLFMKNWEERDSGGRCPAAIDAQDAMSVCERIGIDLDAVSFTQRYWDRVFRYFLDEYGAGRTPNPDVLCNKEIKFRAFLDHALGEGADAIATGHYARVSPAGDGRRRLLKGRDPGKDQSYFLYALDQAQLARAVFPLGELRKSEVRRIALEAGFGNHAKKDSTGICFIGERRFKEFLSRYLPARPGEIRSVDGILLGEHDGLMFHTLGQRKGLGIGGRGGSGEPWYVVAKDLTTNILYVAQGHDHSMLFSRHLAAGKLNWISGAPPKAQARCYAKTRYRQPDQACWITAIDAGRCHVEFERPQRAVTPGQSVVFYQGEECLGGGVIEEVGLPEAGADNDVGRRYA